MHIFGKRGEEILSVDDWFSKAPPKQGARHWKDYRSAKELAKSWFRTRAATPPEELLYFLRRSFVPNELILANAYAECVVALDRFGGEHRNTDLLVLGTAGPRKLSISIEAKADESFGELVGEYYDRCRTVPRSNRPARIDGLSRALFDTDLSPRIRSLRYQLLHAAAGALIAAKQQGAGAAVFLVHEFISDRLNPAKVALNGNDWLTFVEALTGTDVDEVHADRLTGPFKVHGGEFVPSHIPLYVGKFRTLLQEYSIGIEPFA